MNYQSFPFLAWTNLKNIESIESRKINVDFVGLGLTHTIRLAENVTPYLQQKAHTESNFQLYVGMVSPDSI